jgi:ribosomal protein S18 acetylase RimI-like enzyme
MKDFYDYIIRSISLQDESFLGEMLYEAIYVPKGTLPPPVNIINKPELARYIKNWKIFDDLGFLAVDEKNHKSIGAAWIRLMTKTEPGYGYVDDKTPELTLAILPEYRNLGIGSMLLALLLEEADSKYKAVSLSVTRGNPAVKIYYRAGFKTIKTSDTSLIMKRNNPRNK